MSHVPEHIETAAFAAIGAAEVSIERDLGREATHQERAHVMAEAFGNMLGVCISQGAEVHQVEAINRIATRASEGMIAAIQRVSEEA